MREAMKPRREGDAWRPVYSDLEARLEAGEKPYVLLNTVFKAFRQRRREVRELFSTLDDPHLKALCLRFVTWSCHAPIPVNYDCELEQAVSRLSTVDQLALFANFVHNKKLSDVLSNLPLP